MEIVENYSEKKKVRQLHILYSLRRKEREIMSSQFERETQMSHQGKNNYFIQIPLHIKTTYVCVFKKPSVLLKSCIFIKCVSF